MELIMVLSCFIQQYQRKTNYLVMVRVLYDHQAFDLQSHGGLPNGAVQLIKNLPKTIDVKLGVKRTGNIHLLEAGFKQVRPLLFSKETLICKKYFKGKYKLYDILERRFAVLRPWDLNRSYSIRLLKEGQFDVFHPTYFFWYFLDYIGSKPFVLTIHDLTPEHFFEDKNDLQIEARKILINKAAHITVNSEYTRNDVMDYYNVPESKITVIYRGAPLQIEYPKKKKFAFDYLLYVGARTECYKNFLPMLRQLQPFLNSHPDIKLVCTGQAFNEREQVQIKRLGLEKQIICQFCSQEEIMNLYANAICFIYPSLNEGFGLPILEAYSADCPVFLNNRSCFPEIASDAAIFFDLDEKQGNLIEKLEEFIHFSPEERESLLEKQRKRLSFFSWKRSSVLLSQVYETISR